jgi:hypothetical protein
MKKSLIAAAVVFATASFGSVAMAQTVVGNTPQVLDLSDGSAFFGDTFAAGNAGATFDDHFTFTVTGTSGWNFDAHRFVDQPFRRVPALISPASRCTPAAIPSISSGSQLSSGIYRYLDPVQQQPVGRRLLPLP